MSYKRSLASGLECLAVKVKFNNTLPDIPFDPKFILSPLDISRFVKYEPTSLERNSKHELITPHDLGVDIDLILPELYQSSPASAQEDVDRLLADEPSSVASTKKKATALHNKVVPWLKKTEYISTEYNKYGSTSEKIETKVGYRIVKNRITDREDKIYDINRSFEEAQKPIEKHPSKPEVYATNVLPIFPDHEMFKYVFSRVIFDSEPATNTDQMAQAIIRGAFDEETKEEYVVYFLPTEITMADRILDQNNSIGFSEGKEYQYQAQREYNWNGLKNEAEDLYFFTFRDGKVYYNIIDNCVRLNKRRAKVKSIPTLLVKKRDLNDQDIKIQNQRLLKLEKITATTTKTDDASSDHDDEDDDDGDDDDGDDDDEDDEDDAESSSTNTSAATSSSDVVL